MINVLTSEGHVMELSDKILYLSTFINELDKYKTSVTEPIPLIDANSDDVDILNTWLMFQDKQSEELTSKNFIFADFEFKRLDLFETLRVDELLKIMSMALSNQILLLVESCAKVIAMRTINFIRDKISVRDSSGCLVSKISDCIEVTKTDYRNRKIGIRKYPISKNNMLIILKYKTPDFIIKQDDDLLKLFRYNPTFDTRYDFLFSVETNYVVKFTDIYESTKPFVLKYGTSEDLKDSRVIDVIYKIISETDIPKNSTTFEVPNIVKAIDDYAFENCPNLNTVTLGNNIKILGDSCFMNCSSLANINMPTSLSIIGHSTFKNCSSLVSLEIPATTRFILNEAFENCTGLTKLILPSTLEFLGTRALKNTNLDDDTKNEIIRKFTNRVF